MTRRSLLRLAAPIAALMFSVAVSALLLRATGHSPGTAFARMWSHGTTVESLISTVNRAMPLYLSAVAVAIGFKMSLFNIGVDGQYRLAVFFAAWAGAEVALPAPLRVVFIILVAMVVGAGWAGIAGVLKVTRGVSEVISTIMLNFVATAVISYLLVEYAQFETATTPVVGTEPLPTSGRLGSFNRLLEAIGVREIRSGSELYGALVIVILAGLAFYLLVWRTRFGFDLRASGLNPFAAQASGVPPQRMILTSMLLSGAVAGLVGLPILLGDSFKYDTDFVSTFGFAGITVALLGRNNPIGMAAAALLFGFLDRSSQGLALVDIPKEIITIMEGIIVLSVVVAYAITERMLEARETRALAVAGAGP